MARYRKKPVEIDAVQWDGDNQREIADFLGDDFAGWRADAKVLVRTAEGELTASRGDWIIRGVQGEHYPCKPDIFAATYDPVES
jgi:hypothetical protein